MEMQPTFSRLAVDTVQRLDSAVSLLEARGTPTSRAALVREAVVDWLDVFERKHQPVDLAERISA